MVFSENIVVLDKFSSNAWECLIGTSNQRVTNDHFVEKNLASPPH